MTVQAELFGDDEWRAATGPREEISPAAIMEACERIRREWSPREERKRAGRREWSPPVVGISAAAE